MKKIKSITIKFIKNESEESEEKLRIMYGRIFKIAEKNILERRKMITID